MTAAFECEDPVPDWWVPHAGAFPDWGTWRGVAGAGFYGRRLNTSPAVLERAGSPEALAAAIGRRELVWDATGSYFPHLRTAGGDTGGTPFRRPGLVSAPPPLTAGPAFFSR